MKTRGKDKVAPLVVIRARIRSRLLDERYALDGRVYVMNPSDAVAT